MSCGLAFLLTSGTPPPPYNPTRWPPGNCTRPESRCRLPPRVVRSPPTASFTGNPSWASVASALNRIDLNRPLPDYPWPDSTSHSIDLTNAQNQQQYNNALQARQQMALDIFTALWTVTGAGNPATATPPAAGSPSASYDALRWLAQLAVNIVDYIDNDDFLTPFNWNPANKIVSRTAGCSAPNCPVVS